MDEIRLQAFSILIEHIDNNDECQYSLGDLRKLMETFLRSDVGYSDKQLKKKLIRHYGDGLVITEGRSSSGKEVIFTFKGYANKLLHEA